MLGNDLLVAMVGMACVAVLAGAAAFRLLRDRGDRVGSLVLVLILVTAVGFVFGLKDRLFWAHWLPHSAAIIYSNWLPPMLAASAGLAFCLRDRPLWRRAMSAMLLAVLAGLALLQPVLQPVLRPIQGADHWTKDGVALQTRAHTCSAAAGATLLRQFGIEISEAEMVGLCLTDARGTPSLGLWRGLCLATQGHPVRPQAFMGDADQLMRKGPFPSIVVVGLPPGQVDRKYIDQYGWSEGFRHSVVLLGHQPDNQMVVIADPAYGKETWSEEDFRVLFRGEAIHLQTQR